MPRWDNPGKSFFEGEASEGQQRIKQDKGVAGKTFGPQCWSVVWYRQQGGKVDNTGCIRMKNSSETVWTRLLLGPPAKVSCWSNPMSHRKEAAWSLGGVFRRSKDGAWMWAWNQTQHQGCFVLLQQNIWVAPFMTAWHMSWAGALEWQTSLVLIHEHNLSLQSLSCLAQGLLSQNLNFLTYAMGKIMSTTPVFQDQVTDLLDCGLRIWNSAKLFPSAALWFRNFFLLVWTFN
jgi:hypothetical protein